MAAVVARETEIAIRKAALAYGISKKRKNALTAIVCAVVSILIIAHWFPIRLERGLIGLGVGLLWGNAFEYGYHRWLLHWPNCSFGKGHLLHHSTIGQPNEAAHLTFGDSPMRIVLLFASHGVPLFYIAEYRLHLNIFAGILCGWSLYLVLVEEIHWRIHLGGWLPPACEAMRTYHLAHHDIAGGRFNVFLPLFDLILGDIRPPMKQIERILPSVAYQAIVKSRTPVALTSTAREIILCAWLLILALDFRFLRQH